MNLILFLLGSISVETINIMYIGNTNKNKKWFLPIYASYLTSYFIFPIQLNKYSLGVTCILVYGVGILSKYLENILICNKRFTINKIIKSLIILYGIRMIK